MLVTIGCTFLIEEPNCSRHLKAKLVQTEHITAHMNMNLRFILFSITNSVQNVSNASFQTSKKREKLINSIALSSSCCAGISQQN